MPETGLARCWTCYNCSVGRWLLLCFYPGPPHPENLVLSWHRAFACAAPSARNMPSSPRRFQTPVSRGSGNHPLVESLRVLRAPGILCTQGRVAAVMVWRPYSPPVRVGCFRETSQAGAHWPIRVLVLGAQHGACRTVGVPWGGLDDGSVLPQAVSAHGRQQALPPLLSFLIKEKQDASVLL